MKGDAALIEFILPEKNKKAVPDQGTAFRG